MQLTRKTTDQLIAATYRGRMSNYVRLISAIAHSHPKQLNTEELRARIGDINICDLANVINKRITKHGWYVSCHAPPAPGRLIENKFLWGLFPIDQIEE
jgi:hypothetical protein